MTKEKIRDYTLRVSNANKSEMIVILYDIAVTYIDDAISAKEDSVKFRKEIGRIRNTVKELMDSVNTSTEIGMNLLRLYIFFGTQLTKAYTDVDPEPLYHVKSMILKLREAYEAVSKEDKSGPVMEHTEKVYSGLTYNKNSMTENVSDLDGSRGILA